jgi:leucyl aminopeptidase (aminopeptidase T)
MKIPLCSIAIALSSGLAAAGPDLKATSRTIVNDCAGINEGDTVLISGKVSDWDLLEQLAVDVRKLGAFPLISVTSEKLGRRMFDEVPARFDSQVDQFDLKLADTVKAVININSVETYGLFADVPPERSAARAAAGQQVEQAWFKNNIRSVGLGNGLFPTEATAKLYGMSKDQLADLFWKGVNTDYSRLQNTGQSIRKAVEGASMGRITNPNGTDLKFSLAARPVFVSDGVISADDLEKGGPACQVWLPAGEVYFTPVPGSAEGTVVIDRHVFQGQDITGLTLTFKQGRCTDIAAKSGPIDKLKAQYAAATPGKDLLGLVDIGINESVQVPKDSKLLSWIPAGMVTIGLGGNVWAGGDNNSTFFLNGFLPGSTLTLDGKAIVEKGALKQ